MGLFWAQFTFAITHSVAVDAFFEPIYINIIVVYTECCIVEQTARFRRHLVKRYIGMPLSSMLISPCNKPRIILLRFRSERIVVRRARALKADDALLTPTKNDDFFVSKSKMGPVQIIRPIVMDMQKAVSLWVELSLWSIINIPPEPIVLEALTSPKPELDFRLAYGFLIDLEGLGVYRGQCIRGLRGARPSVTLGTRSTIGVAL